MTFITDYVVLIYMYCKKVACYFLSHFRAIFFSQKIIFKHALSGLIFMFNLCAWIHSAAKAPYLARFKVQHCGISGLERLAASDTLLADATSSSVDKQGRVGEDLEKSIYWQACIFKVGDDVRQVGRPQS